MNRFVIERNIPSIGQMSADELREAAAKSNTALEELAPKVHWQHSYVCGDKTFCIYLAEDEAAIMKHAEISGFPADVITQVTGIIDPTTAG